MQFVNYYGVVNLKNTHCKISNWCMMDGTPNGTPNPIKRRRQVVYSINIIVICYYKLRLIKTGENLINDPKCTFNILDCRDDRPEGNLEPVTKIHLPLH